MILTQEQKEELCKRFPTFEYLIDKYGEQKAIQILQVASNKLKLRKIQEELDETFDKTGVHFP